MPAARLLGLVTVMNKSEWLDGEYVNDVADVLLWQYSDNP